MEIFAYTETTVTGKTMSPGPGSCYYIASLIILLQSHGYNYFKLQSLFLASEVYQYGYGFGYLLKSSWVSCAQIV